MHQYLPLRPMTYLRIITWVNMQLLIRLYFWFDMHVYACYIHVIVYACYMHVTISESFPNDYLKTLYYG